MDKENKYIVGIWCATYQQSQYIVDTLNGFTSQQTTFPFLVLLVDDASTDGEQQTITDYINNNFNLCEENVSWTKEDEDAVYVFARHKENKNCFFLSLNLKTNLWKNRRKKDSLLGDYLNSYKYTTICEGDDFWTDPYKLQKQVDFLESHQDYNLVCHNWKVLMGTSLSNSPIYHKYTQPFSFTFATLPWIWITKTLTVMVRTSSQDYNTLSRYQFSRDVHIVYHALKDSKGYFMPDVMAVYRVHEGGVWSNHEVNEKNRTTYNLYKELYSFEPNIAVRKRYMNATLAYFNGLAFGRKTWWHIGANIKLYFEALKNISDVKDIIFCLGGLVPTQIVKWVMKKFKI